MLALGKRASESNSRLTIYLDRLAGWPVTLEAKSIPGLPTMRNSGSLIHWPVVSCLSRSLSAFSTSLLVKSNNRANFQQGQRPSSPDLTLTKIRLYCSRRMHPRKNSTAVFRWCRGMPHRDFGFSSASTSGSRDFVFDTLEFPVCDWHCKA